MSTGLVPRKAMLLAAGEGIRLRPFTERMPKCMVPVAGKPVLEHNIEWLSRFGVADMVINLHHMPDAVRDYFEDGNRWGVNINYSFEPVLLGTAGGVKKAGDYFDGPFIVWYGDNLSDIDLSKLAGLHRQRSSKATVALFHRDDPTASGIVGIDDQQRITQFLEKPRYDQVFSNWVSAGIMLLETCVLDAIPDGRFSDFGHDILPQLLTEDVAMYGYPMVDEQLWWIDTPADLERIQTQYPRRHYNL